LILTARRFTFALAAARRRADASLEEAVIGQDAHGPLEFSGEGGKVSRQRNRCSLAVAEEIRVDNEVFATSSHRCGDAEPQQQAPNETPWMHDARRVKVFRTSIRTNSESRLSNFSYGVQRQKMLLLPLVDPVG
jgi:hypothetical protein